MPVMFSEPGVWLSWAASAFGWAYLCWVGCRVRALPPCLGRSARRRREARRSALFRWSEPLWSWVGALVEAAWRSVEATRLWRHHARAGRAALERLIVQAGDMGGLRPAEVLAMSGLSFVAGALAASWVVAPPLAAAAGLLTATLPVARLSARRAERFAEVERQLPAAIDLLAMALGAGCDFPGAVERVSGERRGVVAEELRLVLQALGLGMTRQVALEQWENRTPVAEVRDLVRAVILAEKKGASVADAIQQQATSSRQRRSVRAEEAAARAGALLMVPLVLLLGCIMLLLLGPMLVQGGPF